MSFLGRLVSSGSRFLARAAPVASFLARSAPSVVSTIGALASNPLLNRAANSFGINPNVMRGIANGASNVGAGLSLIPGVVGDARAAAQGAMSAAQPVKQSMAQLYRQLNPA
jgi:hypothetical protein